MLNDNKTNGNLDEKLNETEIEKIHTYCTYEMQGSGVEWNNIKDDPDALMAIYVLKECIAVPSNTSPNMERYGKIIGNFSLDIKIDLTDIFKFLFVVVDSCNESDEVKKRVKNLKVAYNAIKAFIIPVLKGFRYLNNEEKCLCLLICNYIKRTESDQISISKIKEMVAIYNRNEGFYCPFANIKCEHINKENNEFFCSHFKNTQTENIDQQIDKLISRLCSGDNPVLNNNNDMITIPPVATKK